MSTIMTHPDYVRLNAAANAVESSASVGTLVISAANANDVMREQLEFLIEHAQDGNCGCEQCQRYLRARTLLMEAFADSPRAALMKKASTPSGN